MVLPEDKRTSGLESLAAKGIVISGREIESLAVGFLFTLLWKRVAVSEKVTVRRLKFSEPSVRTDFFFYFEEEKSSSIHV